MKRQTWLVGFGFIGLALLLFFRATGESRVAGKGEVTFTGLALEPGEEEGSLTEDEDAQFGRDEPVVADPNGESAFDIEHLRSGRASVQGRLDCTVLDLDGQPLVGAFATLSPLTDSVALGYESTYDNGWLWRSAERTEGFLSARTEAYSDSDGAVRIPLPDENLPEAGAVLWITHPGHLAHAVAVSVDPFEAAESVIRLVGNAEHVVRVVDGKGRPVAGARVLHRAMPGGQLLTEGVTQNVRQVLLRSYETGAQGSAVLHGIEGPQVLVASIGMLCSAPVALGDSGDATLVLLGVASIEGTVSTVPGFELGQFAMVTIEALLKGSGGEIELASGAVTDGKFGPIDVPTSGLWRGFNIRLIRGANETVREFIPVPRAGANVVVDLFAKGGDMLWFHFSSKETEDAIEGAEVRVAWESDRGARIVRRATTGPGGWAGLTSLPRDTAYELSVSASGYLDTTYPGFLHLPEQVQAGVFVEVALAHAVELEVSSGGEPVVDFDVWVQSAGSFYEPEVRNVRSAVDGSAVLRGLREGEATISVLAGSRGFIRAQPIQIPSPGPIRIELETGGRATGVVVEAATGTPIAGALVGPELGVELGVSTTFEEWAGETDGEGRFRLFGIPEDSAFLRIQASGMKPTEARQGVRVTEGLDFGVVALYPAESVTLVLPIAGVSDPTGHSIEFEAPDNGHGRGWFSEEGIFEFEPAGYVAQFDLIYPDDGRDSFLLRHPGGRSRVVLPIAGSRRLRFDFVDGSGIAAEADGVLTLLCEFPDGLDMVRSVPIPRGATTVSTSAIDARSVEVLWLGAVGESRSWAKHPLDGPGGQVLRLTADCETALVLCLTPGGDPAVGARCLVLQDRARDSSSPLGGAESDADGRFEVPLPSSADFSLSITSADQMSTAVVTREQFLAGPRPFQVVLGGDESVSVRVLASGGPLSGARVMLMDTAYRAVVSMQYAGVDGIVRFEGLAPGTYGVSVTSSGLFEGIASFASGVLDRPVELRLFEEVEDVELVFLDAGGEALAGLVPRLRHVESGVTLREWRRFGVLGASDSVTSSGGGVVFGWLPAGTYVWSVEAEERVFGGSFEVVSDSGRVEVSAAP